MRWAGGCPRLGCEIQNGSLSSLSRGVPWLTPHPTTSSVSAWKKTPCLGWKEARALCKPLSWAVRAWDDEVCWRAHLCPVRMQPGEPVETPVTCRKTTCLRSPSHRLSRNVTLAQPVSKAPLSSVTIPHFVKKTFSDHFFRAEWLKTDCRKKPVCAVEQIGDTGE